MRFKGNTLKALATKVVVLPRPEGQENIPMLVRSGSVDEPMVSRKLFPDPDPPKGFVYADSKKAGVPLRDPDTQKPLMEFDYDDVEYLDGMRRSGYMRTMFMFLNAIDGDENIDFECGPKTETAEWYQKAAEEVTKAGISAGDISLVIEESHRLSNIDADAPTRAAEAFSSREGHKKAE